MENKPAIAAAAVEMGVATKDEAALKAALVARINQLLTDDFDRLISILYRMDVDEKKIKKLLNDNPGEDAARIIADLVIERQVQKIASRSQYTRSPDPNDENEKW